MSTTKLALFDFDGTLTRGDSLKHFAQPAFGQKKFAKALVAFISSLLPALVGKWDRGQSKERFLESLLGGMREEELLEAGRSFAAAMPASFFVDEALNRLAWHQRMGHRCMVVSASPEFYLTPWAKGKGIEAVLATRLEVAEGVVTGRFNGANCWGQEKVRRLQEYVGDLGPYEIWAYGDSRGDKELLAVATHPYFRPFDN